MQLYVDEDVAREVALGLRDTHDVIYVPEGPNRAKSDAWHLQQASIALRVLVTVNHNDFKFLHRVWTSMRVFGVTHSRHAGIITATRRPNEASVWIGAINKLLQEEDTLGGRLLVWHATDGWREDDWRPDE